MEDGGLTTADPDETALGLDELGDPLGDLRCYVVDLDVALVNMLMQSICRSKVLGSGVMPSKSC